MKPKTPSSLKHNPYLLELNLPSEESLLPDFSVSTNYFNHSPPLYEQVKFVKNADSFDSTMVTAAPSIPVASATASPVDPKASTMFPSPNVQKSGSVITTPSSAYDSCFTSTPKSDSQSGEVDSNTNNKNNNEHQNNHQHTQFREPGNLIAMTSRDYIVEREAGQQQQQQQQLKKQIPSSRASYHATTGSHHHRGNSSMSYSSNSTPVISMKSFDPNSPISFVSSTIFNAISFAPSPRPVIVSSAEDDSAFTDLDSIFSKDTRNSEVGSLAGTCGSVVAEPAEREPETRGRLYVRVEGLCDLKLPIDSTRNPRFTMNLDNQLQSVTIEPIELTSNNPLVGQEFELIIGPDDFQIMFTFAAQMNQLKKKYNSIIPNIAEIEHVSKQIKYNFNQQQPPQKYQTYGPTSSKSKIPSKLRSMFRHSSGSHTVKTGQLRRTSVRHLSISEPIPQHHISSSRPPPRKEYDLWDGLMGPNGEFGRTRMRFSNYVDQVYGRPETFTVDLMDEWVETSTRESVVSIASLAKRTERIGSLNVTLMFVPTAPTYPNSIDDAVQEYKQTQEFYNLSFSGYLTQEGGDCKYLRRCWFEYNNSKLVSYTENMKKVRAMFDLSNVASVVQVDASNYDDDDCGFVYNVDKSFNIVFKNGTILHFLTDRPDQRQQWIEVLSVAIEQVNKKTKTWVDVVMEKTKARS